MARNVSDEELQLKKRARRRLVGAVVLVTTVAVVLPMILDSEPKPATQSINIQIPPPDSGVLNAKPVPLKTQEAPVTKPEPRAEPKPEAGAPPKAEPRTEARGAVKDASEKAQTKAAVDPASKSLPKPTSKSEPAAEHAAKAKAESAPAPPSAASEPAKAAAVVAAKPAAPAAKADPVPSGGFAIQVVALADVAKAKAMQQQITGAGLQAYTEVVQTAKGPVTRVRVGPYASREAAELGLKQLKKLELDGKVVPR